MTKIAQHWSTRIQDKLSHNASLMLVHPDPGSTVKQHWLNVSLLPGERQVDTLTQCWINVETTSLIMAQHLTNIGSVHHVD